MELLNLNFLLDLAFILLCTKLFGVVTKRIQMPQVVGALIAGLILGPSITGIIHETTFIRSLAEIGVIVIMFSAGLETDIKELKKSGKASFIIALFGVLVPLIIGFGIAMLFTEGPVDNATLFKNIFIGIILTATSVSITVETLREMGKLNSKVGTIILGAALIDDILGVILLTIVTSLADSSGNVLLVLGKIVAFFVFAFAVGIPVNKLFNHYSKMQGRKRRFPILAFVFCLVMAWSAEYFFGVADIAAAFIAGVILSSTMHAKYINRRFEIVSYMLISPIFFANIGINVNFSGLSPSILLFSGLLLVGAILSKVIGCGIGAKLCHFSNKDSLRIGVGMVARSEVALIVTNKGVAAGIIPDTLYAPIVIIVIITSIVTPIFLKIVFKKDKNELLLE